MQCLLGFFVVAMGLVNSASVAAAEEATKVASFKKIAFGLTIQELTVYSDGRVLNDKETLVATIPAEVLAETARRVGLIQPGAILKKSNSNCISEGANEYFVYGSQFNGGVKAIYHDTGCSVSALKDAVSKNHAGYVVSVLDAARQAAEESGQP